MNAILMNKVIICGLICRQTDRRKDLNNMPMFAIGNQNWSGLVNILINIILSQMCDKVHTRLFSLTLLFQKTNGT